MREHVSRRRFDVLISDLNLPDGDGIDLLREAKHKQQLKAIRADGRGIIGRPECGALWRGSIITSRSRWDFRPLRVAISKKKLIRRIANPGNLRGVRVSLPPSRQPDLRAELRRCAVHRDG